MGNIQISVTVDKHLREQLTRRSNEKCLPISHYVKALIQKDVEHRNTKKLEEDYAKESLKRIESKSLESVLLCRNILKQFMLDETERFNTFIRNLRDKAASAVEEKHKSTQ